MEGLPDPSNYIPNRPNQKEEKMVSSEQTFPEENQEQDTAYMSRERSDMPKPPGIPSLKVFGIGGGGCNAINRMYKEKLALVEYYGVNTDAQHLSLCDVGHKIAIGQSLTKGLGAGANPDLGRQAAEENREQLEKALSGADMVFVASGMGGGTGTGAVPIVAQLAKEAGALTVAVVTKPFSFEAGARRKNAEEGIARLRDHVDTLIVIPNDSLLEMERQRDQTVTWEDALKIADSVLHYGIQSIAEVITVPGEINVDFADIKAILGNAGQAWLAMGRGKGETRAKDAAKQAIQSPLLDIDLAGAKRILFVITSGNTLSLKEVQDVAGVVEDLVDPEANVIFGTTKDPKMDDEVKVTMVAAAFPVVESDMSNRDEDLRRLLQDAIPEEGDDLDIPSFIRRQSSQRNRGFFR
jgi:cell division protein FtsZ